MTEKNEDNEKKYSPFKRTKSVKISSARTREPNIWRSTSLSKIMNCTRTRSNSWVLSSRNCNNVLIDERKTNNSNVSALGVTASKLENKASSIDRNRIVTIVLVEAKGLPPVPEDGVTHKLYCKFRLGSVNYKTKSVPSTNHPKWGERFILRRYRNDSLTISVWDKGKQKNFMGSCILDLSVLEMERTHEIWQQLDDGYGIIHLSITLCLSRSSKSSLTSKLLNSEDVEQSQYTYDLRNNWQVVGSLHVNIFGARGLVSNSYAYCTLELDNEMIQTPKEGPGSEPSWNKNYVCCVYDVTSTLNIKVYGKSFSSALLYEPIGKVSIPLLMIINGEQRWYALKDRNKKHLAKGNCPRICLQMTLIWNPVKASLRLFRPKSDKYVKKSKKYDVARIYSNSDFIGKLFDFLYEINESFKRLFEWNDPELSFLALGSWLVFCFYFRLWMIPLLLLIPFTYYCLSRRSPSNKYHTLRSNSDISYETNDNDTKNGKSFSGKAQHLKHTTIVIINGIEYISSLAERLYNLVSFKVPFLSYLTMILLTISSLVFYFVPYNYLLMALGIYKYTRKYLNPDRVLNNDLIDFLSRIPDNRKLKEWKELSVPEPVQKQSSGE